MRKKIVALFTISCLLLIGLVFWFQEVKYLTPTPIPENYHAIKINSIISLKETSIKLKEGKKILHFFNPECPCSKFNISHFQSLYRKFKNDYQFIVVIPKRSSIEKAKSVLDLPIDILQDSKGEMARECGVYSTPQAVIVSKENRLLYKGNYNKSRYCSDPKSNYVEIAMSQLITKKDVTILDPFASISYGCSYTEKQ